MSAEAEHCHGHCPDAHADAGDHRETGSVRQGYPAAAPMNIAGKIGPPRKLLSDMP